MLSWSLRSSSLVGREGVGHILAQRIQTVPRGNLHLMGVQPQVGMLGVQGVLAESPRAGSREPGGGACSLGQVHGKGRNVGRGEGAPQPRQLSEQRQEGRRTGWPPTGATTSLSGGPQSGQPWNKHTVPGHPILACGAHRTNKIESQGCTGASWPCTQRIFRPTNGGLRHKRFLLYLLSWGAEETLILSNCVGFLPASSPATAAAWLSS